MGRVRDRVTRGDHPLSILQAIVLGITQGVTEFAPVSSSGHLILVPWLFDWSILADPNLNKTFDVALHLGTLVGALVYFRHDVARYLAAWSRSIRARTIRSTDERLAWALVIGTIPGVIVGATLESVIQDDARAAVADRRDARGVRRGPLRRSTGSRRLGGTWTTSASETGSCSASPRRSRSNRASRVRG